MTTKALPWPTLGPTPTTDGTRRDRPAVTHQDPQRSSSWAAARYWLLTYEDEELRFSLHDVAERWMAELAADGVRAELSWHGPTTPADPHRESI